MASTSTLHACGNAEGQQQHQQAVEQQQHEMLAVQRLLGRQAEARRTQAPVGVSGAAVVVEQVADNAMRQQRRRRSAGSCWPDGVMDVRGERRVAQQREHDRRQHGDAAAAAARPTTRCRRPCAGASSPPRPCRMPGAVATGPAGRAARRSWPAPGRRPTPAAPRSPPWVSAEIEEVEAEAEPISRRSARRQMLGAGVGEGRARARPAGAAPAPWRVRPDDQQER